MKANKEELLDIVRCIRNTKRGGIVLTIIFRIFWYLMGALTIGILSLVLWFLNEILKTENKGGEQDENIKSS